MQRNPYCLQRRHAFLQLRLEKFYWNIKDKRIKDNKFICAKQMNTEEKSQKLEIKNKCVFLSFAKPFTIHSTLWVEK